MLLRLNSAPSPFHYSGLKSKDSVESEKNIWA